MSAVTKNSCLETHLSIDKFITTPLQTGVKNMIHHLMVGSDYGIQNRLMIAAQAIISLIILPFKMLFALFTGIDTMLHPSDGKSWVNLTYALGSVAAHAVLVPTGLILALLPMSTIEEIKGLKDDTSVLITGFGPVTAAFDDYTASVEKSMPKRKEESCADVNQEHRPAPRHSVPVAAAPDSRFHNREAFQRAGDYSGENFSADGSHPRQKEAAEKDEYAF